ncbi:MULTISPECIES: DUF805 domain-containing protein [unclassified Streptomyces]|uniref:DUF805 domain-containing protein n=1 Tax=unclassified Streptomyces TaxID=2593676 RepID=UPI002255999A|nr:MULTISPECIES: DUF805 domain-containing protein [unclassified Streptomyces]MCX4524662.1 DUF805 domain-containing protein [Streptomyces sp. NBC_01551]MCX4544830.1 DUF805 domain-containing protein [Streptomyces sp. NBC_01565]
MNYYTDVMKKYATFSGRARRQEFWMFFLINFGIAIVLMILDGVFGTYPLLTGIYALATFLPNLALTVRRLHDTGKSGWWYFVSVIPLVGFIWIIVLMATEGHAQPNAYGVSPKAVQA